MQRKFILRHKCAVFFTEKVCLLLLYGTQETETQVVVLAVRGAEAVAGHLAADCVAEVAAAAVEAVSGVVRACLPHPLPHVAAHVVQAVSICHLLRYRMRYVVAVVTVPGNLVRVVAS